MVECVATADFATCEAVPAGGPASLANPLGGIATDMAGPARYTLLFFALRRAFHILEICFDCLTVRDIGFVSLA